MKTLSLWFHSCLIIMASVLASTQLAHAQTDADAIMIPKNYFCGGLMYSNSSWKNYWEGTFKRSNDNIGTINTNMYAAMINYGISNSLNMLASVPYVTTHASGGTLTGLKGIQDLMVSLKWRALKTNIGKGKISLFAIGSASVPLTNYQADFLPLAIGSQSKSIMLRGLVDYNIGHYFISGSSEYMRRSLITIDRTSYYTTELHFTNQVSLPDMANYALRTGYRSSKWIAEVVLENNTTLGGFDIRKNDMPFASNKMNNAMAGVNFKYSSTRINGLELTAGGDYVLAGRNVGQSTIIHGGAYYLFNLSKKKK